MHQTIKIDAGFRLDSQKNAGKFNQTIKMNQGSLSLLPVARCLPSKE
jgi:hypothetical protein